MATLPVFAFVIIIILMLLSGMFVGATIVAPAYISACFMDKITAEMKKKGADAFYVQAVKEYNKKGI